MVNGMTRRWPLAYVLIVAHFQTQSFFQQARERQAVAESNSS